MKKLDLVSRVRMKKYRSCKDAVSYTHLYWLNLWSDFTRDIDAGIPIHTSLKADNGGHAVVTVGWYIVRYGAKDFRYLQVINGWQKSIKYAGFDGYYNQILGIAVKI